MPSHMHEIAVEQILLDHPTALTRGFMKAINEILAPDTGAKRLVRPDAYKIDWETNTVTVFEVEVNHPLNDNTMAAYCILFWWLDGEGWDLILETRDRYGHPRPALNMEGYAYAMKRRLATSRQPRAPSIPSP